MVTLCVFVLLRSQALKPAPSGKKRSQKRPLHPGGTKNSTGPDSLAMCSLAKNASFRPINSKGLENHMPTIYNPYRILSQVSVLICTGVDFECGVCDLQPSGLVSFESNGRSFAKKSFQSEMSSQRTLCPEKRSPYERQRIDACAAHDMRGDVSSNPGETRILTARDY